MEKKVNLTSLTYILDIVVVIAWFIFAMVLLVCGNSVGYNFKISSITSISLVISMGGALICCLLSILQIILIKEESKATTMIMSCIFSIISNICLIILLSLIAYKIKIYLWLILLMICMLALCVVFMFMVTYNSIEVFEHNDKSNVKVGNNSIADANQEKDNQNNKKNNATNIVYETDMVTEQKSQKKENRKANSSHKRIDKDESSCEKQESVSAVKKLVDLCKGVFLIGSIFILILSTIITIGVCCFSHGDKYSYKKEILGLPVSAEIVFENNNILTITTNTAFQATEKKSYYYKIENGMLYTKEKEQDSYDVDNAMKINAFEINMGENSGFEIICKCFTTITVRAVGLTFILIFGIIMIICIIVTVLDKKGKINYQPKRLGVEGKVVESYETSKEDNLKQRLEKIKEMKDNGEITDGEYKKLKAKIIEEF